MARIFIRDLFKFRTTTPFLSHPKTLTSSKKSPYCAIFSSNFQDFDQNLSFSSKFLNFINGCKSLTHLYQIQAHLIVSGLLNDPCFAGTVLKISSNLCDVNYTVLIFKYMQFYDAFCVNTVIKAYASSSLSHKSIVFYFEMLKEGFLPNNFSFPPLISACAKMGNLHLGQKCHGQVVKVGVDGVLHVQNALLHLYACCGLMDVARHVFAEMHARDVVSWNTIVDGFAKVGEMSVAHCLFDAMPEKNVVSWNIMITGYLDFGNPGNGLKLFREMMRIGCRGNNTTMVSVATACGRSARLEEGKSVHGFLVRGNVVLSLILSTALIDMYSRCGKPDIARMIFDRVKIRNLVCWNAMILGHCIHGIPLDGLSLFAEMVGVGKIRDRVLPDEITFIGVLCACAREGLLTEGRNYFGQMTDVFRIMPTFSHYWCMANLYAKVGLTEEAVEILRSIPLEGNALPESSLWARLLASSRFQGDMALGEKIAKELIEQDPHNYSYYALLLNVNAVAGRWEEVARTKEMMKERGITRVPGCSLEDLKEIVHNTELGDKWQPGGKIADMLIVK